MAKKKKTTLIKQKTNKDEAIRFRMSEDERKEIERKATLYAGGNISAWCLYASKNYVPSKEELE